MSSSAVILAVAVLAGASCALAGVFLVLRRMAMIADAISHAILPGLVAGYWLANGPNVFVGFLGATAAGVLTVVVVELLTRTKRVKEDSAIGLTFTVMFALGVFLVSKFFSHVHLDTDAVLYGEIAFAPFDTLELGGRNMGPQSLWILGGLLLLNALFLALFYKELKVSTFDPVFAASLGFAPAVLHYLLMTLVAVTTVGAFSAVGAILAVALIVVPPVTASLLTRRLPALIALSLLIGAVAGALGYWLATIWDVSISGMIASCLGVLFGGAFLLAPRQGLVAQALRRTRQRIRFATEMLVVHLSNHAGTDAEAEESKVAHLERELGWPAGMAKQVSTNALRNGFVVAQNGSLKLTDAGVQLAHEVGAR